MRVSASRFHYKWKRLRFRGYKTKGVKEPKPLFRFSTSTFQQNDFDAKYQQHQTGQKCSVLESNIIY